MMSEWIDVAESHVPLYVRFGLGTYALLTKALPLLGLTAVATGLIVVWSETTKPQSLEMMIDSALRTVLFLLGLFIGSYLPLEGQPDVPSTASVIAIVCALLTSLGSVALAVLKVMARQVLISLSLLRGRRMLVLGDSPQIATLVAGLRKHGFTPITAGPGQHTSIPVGVGPDLSRSWRLRRALRQSSPVCVLYQSSAEGAITASVLRRLSPRSKVYQIFDKDGDRLVFRNSITGGVLPNLEAVSPTENLAAAIVRSVWHLSRTETAAVGIYLEGQSELIDTIAQQIRALSEAIAFTGEICIVASPDHADVVVLCVPEKEYVAAVERVSDSTRLVIIVAPEKYFAAIEREDLSPIPLETLFASASDHGYMEWRGQLAIADPAVLGYSIAEITGGIKLQWARTFHNAHSDFGASKGSFPNRWLAEPPHPRLVAMAEAAVDLMVADLNGLGIHLVIRNGPHDDLLEHEVEMLAKNVHSQYLMLKWTDDKGVSRNCSQYCIDPGGRLLPAQPPRDWEHDLPINQQRNIAMVRNVYPAMAAAFGYRLTRRGL